MNPESIEAAHAYAAAAEKKVWDIDGIDPMALPAPIDHVCVIGGGQMGSGIATALLEGGMLVTLVEPVEAKLAEVAPRIRGNWANRIKRGQLTEAEVDERMQRLSVVAHLSDVAPVELYIEAAWESMEVKKDIFRRLCELAPAGAVLATNTSTLDINAIAASTTRPADVIGLHFFSPAHVMRLLEVVRGKQTSDRAIVTALALAKRLRKVPVVVGVCFGFVGNRIFAARDQQANQMLLEGATPQQIDKALVDFGFPMGTFTLFDMAGGIELGWRLRQETGEVDEIGDALYHSGRLGQRVGKGYYRYEPGSRTPVPDPETDRIIAEVRAKHGVAVRAVSDQEIIDRMILPMINEAAKILDEGIAQRASDIDVVWNTGYGWPIDRGGPVYFGDQVTPTAIVARLRELRAAHGDHFTPSPLLERCAAEGKGLGESAAN